MATPLSSSAAEAPSPRRDWQPLLAALPARQLAQVLEPLRSVWTVDDLLPPEAGLGLLQLPDSVQGMPWFAGEIPVARSRVRVRDDQGREAEGGAILLDDRATRARDLALCDAVLAGQLSGYEALQALLEPGRQCRNRQYAERQAMRTKTRVDFGVLGGQEGDQDD